MTDNPKEIAFELKDKLLHRFEDILPHFKSGESDFFVQKRKKAIVAFKEVGFPSTKNESWRKTNLKPFLSKDYSFSFPENENGNQIPSEYKCKINQFDTDLYTMVNGKWVDGADGVTTYDNGTIVSSMSSAKIAFPEMFEKHFGQCVVNERNGLIALNSAFYEEGYFVYVPDNVEHNTNLQMVNIIETNKNILTNTRNIIVLGKNARLKLVHCDDSVNNKYNVINNVTEICLDSGAFLDFYKLQNKADEAAVLTNTFVSQEADSNFISNTIVLNGGLIRNDTHVNLNGKGANADVNGLYLMDKKQIVDNHVFISHNVSNCTSNQLFKGIVDEDARSIFNGHTLVKQDAQQTVAYQSNNNIQLTKTSKIDTHPFLEIYADDVKCSHGATVGQLDLEALFYLMQRGICERNAKMLLMLAFVGQIVNKIQLPNLQKSIDELVKKRLKGELSSCEQCSIQCAEPDRPLHFEIDMSKV